MKILIVEDKAESLYMLETLLKGSGYEVMSTKNGVEALEKLKRTSVDMIISDILMPKMDGFQLCRECKSDDTLRKIPFVFYTATYTDKKDEEFALSLGAEKFIIKPVDPEVFLKILEGAIEEHRKGAFVAPKKPIEKEEVYLAEYNKRLIKKLEKKMLDLEKAHKELKESEQMYRELVDNANDAVIVIEPTGYLGFVNPKFCETMGYTMEEAKKHHISKLVHPEDLTMVTENFRKRLAGEEVPRNYEFRALTKSGETIYVDYNASLIEREGKTVGIQAIIRNITERKRAEEQLRILSSVAEQSTNSIAILDKQGIIVEYVNPKLLELYEISPDEVVGKNWRSWLSMYSTLREKLLEMRNTVLERGTTWKEEVTDRSKRGEVVWRAATIFPIKDAKGEIAHIVYVSEDITERKRAEELLRNAEEDWRNSFNSLEDVMLIIDRDYNIENINEIGLKLLGKSKEEVIGKKCYQIISGADSPGEDCPCMKSLETKKVETLDRDEERFGKYYSIKSSPIFDENGAIIKFVDLMRDITERKQAEEEVKKSQDFLATIIDNIPDSVTIRDSQHRFVLVNQAYRNVTGNTKDEITGKTAYREKDKEVFQTGKGLDILERTYTDLEGKRHYISVKKAPLTDESGKPTHVLTISRDITERKQAEEALKHTALSLQKHVEKLEESKKKIAEAYRLKEHFLKETSHRIITPVAIIGGHTDLLLKSSNLDDDQKEKIRIIRKRNEEVQKLTRDALAGKYLEEEEGDG